VRSLKGKQGHCIYTLSERGSLPQRPTSGGQSSGTPGTPDTSFSFSFKYLLAVELCNASWKKCVSQSKGKRSLFCEQGNT